jgi:hypothetical protein
VVGHLDRFPGAYRAKHFRTVVAQFPMADRPHAHLPARSNRSTMERIADELISAVERRHGVP